ncbi:MAG TPA: hypothetical protein VIP76_00685 [Luteimonas sp.]
MSESNNQAGSAKRRNARVIKVAPVTRAIRAALAVSATTLALTASGSLFASNCVTSVSTSIHCSGTFHDATVRDVATHAVFDLTTVRGDDAPGSVVPAWQQSRVSSANDTSAISSLGDVAVADESQSLGAVQDLVAIDVLTPGPGGVSGSDDSIYINVSGVTSFNSNTGVFAATPSAYGIADFAFAASDHFTAFTNNAAISASGNTWAAGLELEAVTYANGIRNSSTGSITTSASGTNGQAWGIYAVGGDEAHVYNDGAIDVSASGTNGTATGLFSYSPDGVATADNTGSIGATAGGNGGQAWGVYAAGATGATVTNAGDVSADAGSFIYSNATATGIAAYSNGGTATASNTGTGSISAYASGKYGQAFGIYAAGDTGASVDNAGSIVAESYGAYGAMGAAIGISAFASTGDVDLINTGTVFAGADGNATALRGDATLGDVSIDSSYSAFAYSEFGNAIAIYGYATGGDVAITNSGYVGAYSYYGLADGIFASGVSVDVVNTGDIYAAGYTWAAGIEAQGSDLVSVTNDGTITAFAYAGDYINRIYGHAFGIYATAGAGGASIENTGDITVDGAYSNGIYVLADGSITIANSGDIDVGTTYAQYATGIHVATNGDGSNASVVNSGNITADSRYGAIGIEVIGTGPGSTGSVSNSGNIYADQATFFGSDATGIVVSTDGNASVDNSGLVIATAGGSAYGVIAQSFNGDASVTNSGDIGAYSTQSYSGAYGIISFSQNGGASVDNSGGVIASSSFNGGYLAMGIQASGMTGAGVNNSGTVDVDAWYAYGINASSGLGDVSVSNTDTGIIGVDGISFALGVIGLSTDGNVAIDNAGEISSYAYGQAVGTFASSAYGSVTSDNSGYIQAFSVYGPAVAIFARADEGDVAVGNSGAVLAASPYGDAVGIRASGLTADVTNTGMVLGISVFGLATGIDVYGADSATIGNDGSVVASSKYGNAQGIYAAGGGDVLVSNGADGEIGAYSYDGFALGVLAYSTAGDSTIDNAGIVVAQGYGGALGLYAGAYGDATITSSGPITVEAINGNANAISGYSAAGDVSLDNSGPIDVYSYAGSAIGMNGYAAAGDVHIDNSGTIDAYSYYGLADGIFASGTSVDVTNTGSINANGYGWAAGIEAQGVDQATINNDGAITAYAYANDYTTQRYGHAYGIFATGGAGGVTIGNSGSITATGFYATGIAAQSGGAISITSTGDISVGNDYTAVATGIRAINDYEASDITVVNGGDITAHGYYGATGIDVSATGSGSSANASNSGHLYAAAGSKYGVAIGILSTSSGGAANANNSGTIFAGSDKYLATGIQVDGATGATATNSGSISVEAKYAYGIVGTASQGDVSITNASTGSIEVMSAMDFAVGALGISTVGDVVVDNAGSIDAAAGSNAFGVIASAEDGNATAINSGDIHAYSYSATAQGILVDATNGDAVAHNSGSIDAVSPQGTAIGIYGRNGGGLVSITSSGDITATGEQAIGVLGYGFASAVTNAGNIDAAGSDVAHGVWLDVYANGLLSNATTGSITATAATEAIGALVASYAGVASVNNAGSIDASTTYAGGLAAGVMVQGYAGALVTNSGTIRAESVADSDAIGVIAQAYGNLLVDNAGLITATDDDYAVAVSLDSAAGIATLRNAGILRTYSTIESQIAVLGGDGVQHVLNYGDIYGAIVTGGGDDVMFNGNAGIWHVINHSTDFGDGDDSITNAVGGTIALSNGAIHLGASGSAGNMLTNNGAIQVRGHALIDMGTGASPLTNDGVVDFVDGAPNDVLTIIGDLAGDGAINVDISALNQAADLLYVDGNVVDGTAQTVNVSFAGVPTTMHVDPIDFAFIAGDSTASSFVGGGVVGFGPGNFLDLQVTVTSQIDASNATDDVFSVGVDVAGLNDTGALAASIASGAQSLINGQVGTWRQRMGVLPAKGQDAVGLSPWIRFFSDKGEIDPTHVAGNFGSGGNFRYDQSNSGSEFGMNVNIHGGVNIGLLLANSEGTQRLLDSGVGTNRMDGSAFGLYTTWIGSNGFYVDASYRWLDFDVDLTSAAGLQSTRAKGNAFNVEAGYTAWTVAGIDIAPQLQYTRSAVGNIDTLRGDRVEFVANGGNSSRGRLGVSFSKTIDNAGWIWTPYGSVNAVREFDGETTYTVADTFFGSTNTEGTSAMVELGLGAQKNGLSVTGGANWTDGGAMQSFVGGQLVLRYSW